MYMRKKAYTLIALVLIIMSMIMSACTKKDNLTGDNWSGIKPQLATVNSFEMGYSYTHEGTVKGNESYLICGSEGGIEAVSILNFIGLTDTMTVIGQPTLKIVATRRSGISRSPLELTFHKLNKNWAADSTNNVLDTDITPLNFTYSVTQDTISSAGDTLTINIPAAVIQNWKTENVTGLNLVIKLTGTGWLEFKATELAGGPLLSFEYQIANSTTNQNYSQKAVKDSYRISGTQTDISNNIWKLKNLLPQRMYVKFTLPDSIFKYSDGSTPLSSQDRRRMTINKAELVLQIKNNPYYYNSLCTFLPYNVKKDSLISPVVLQSADLEFISNSISSFKKSTDTAVNIDITSITQGFTSTDLQNRGIVIKLMSELQNFGNLEFWHYSDAPSDSLKPKVKIYYTVPYLKGD